jgi:enterochelin esterase-like enzyme
MTAETILRTDQFRIVANGFRAIVVAPMNETVAKIKSSPLQNERSIWIRAPRGPARAEQLTVFLDGELYRDRVEALSILDDLKDSIPDGWFVFVSMESEEARWLECPCYPPFARFIVQELLPWLENRHPELRTIQQRTLVGLSYTGLAAAFVVKEFPGVFQKVISQSGSFWWQDCALVEQYRKLGRLPTDFYLDVGTREAQENVQHRENVFQEVSQIEGVRRFRDVLLERGHSVRYVEFDGGHSFKSWKETLPGALRWALSRVGCVAGQSGQPATRANEFDDKDDVTGVCGRD